MKALQLIQMMNVLMNRMNSEGTRKDNDYTARSIRFRVQRALEPEYKLIAEEEKKLREKFRLDEKNDKDGKELNDFQERFKAWNIEETKLVESERDVDFGKKVPLFALKSLEMSDAELLVFYDFIEWPSEDESKAKKTGPHK